MLRRISVLAAALALLTACGGKDEPAGAPAPSGQDSPVSAVAKDDKLAAELPPEIASAGRIRIGSNIQNPPNNFYAADGKTPIGSEVDLAKAIGKRLGVEMVYEDMAFGSLITSLQAGRIDLTMAAMNDTKERQKSIDFVDYFTSGITIMVQKGNPAGIKSPDDLCGKAVAVNSGSSQETYAKERGTICTQQGKGEVTVAATDSDTQNQNQLRTGRVQAILNDLPTAVYVAQTAGEGKYFEVVNLPPINGGPYGIGVNKQNPKLAKAVQLALQSLVDDGTYTKILQSWNVTQGAIQKVTVNGGP
ncbi:ABC transporter substrate-binding protein [Kibdelosporangium persicum]|uniref:Periplasmic glutamine-binding protein permease (GlnH) n=1 Tax=Kibdelosporangium persicum TaxID=2698649 RepID=A0ABX2F0B4_9PSEU|nr:ABC transporter substrate-binding protein [Kibdelosporangium persicum]NRN64363.1 Periplasmic glutamine-binding protein permease (GlnH) [Kibdelosporangium persicum]